MTVSSLWKVLDNADCGKQVGTDEFSELPGNQDFRDLNPWNVNQNRPQKTRAKVLAIDLSIWICESLTAQGLSEHHKNPALHLVFSRAVKLLQLGCRLIVVVEGRRRIQETGEKDKFHRRRSGTLFWRACEECQDMLERLGVIVVRAKAEAEALCALLSLRNIVDGVISNDGDCLLFGAKVVYTKFSLDNLANGRVIRYDADELGANIQISDDNNIAKHLVGSLTLSRYDLIAFAILTGSDLAGTGLPKVGDKKAVRFIRKCQIDYPLSVETASIDEIKSWAQAAAANVCLEETLDHSGAPAKVKHCSRCGHEGSKRSHEKHGCQECGTKAGEPCYEETADDRFRKSLRDKALAMKPKFDPSQVVSAYLKPNDKQLPIQLAQATKDTIGMKRPNLSSLLQMQSIVKGQTREGSREYVARAVGRLLSRSELHESSNETADDEGRLPAPATRERPVPQEITKCLHRNGVACYVVNWIVSATVTDDYGEGIDGYEFSTIEPCSIVEAKYAELVQAFKAAEKERTKQGDGEKMRRKAFLEEEIFQSNKPAVKEQTKKRKEVKRRVDFFEGNIGFVLQRRQKQHRRQRRGVGDEVNQLMNSIQPRREISRSRALVHQDKQPREVDKTCAMEGLVCHMGGMDIEVTPVLSNKGAFPPRNIYVRQSFVYSP